MNFRRQPFQFSSIDPVKRYAELEKRFGLPTNSNDMYVDCMNPDKMGAGEKSSGSPRLQHRVPLFTQGLKQEKSEQNNVDASHKPRIRVVPIQVEGVDGTTKCNRTLTGLVGSQTDSLHYPLVDNSFQSSRTVKQNIEVENLVKPKVCNIPIKVDSEIVDSVLYNQVPELEKQETVVETNDCVETKETSVKQHLSIPLKQIEIVLNKLETYQSEIINFTGGPKNKQYRYLDEMLTQLMLDLDNIETQGINEIRQSRKAAVKKVQACIDLLESKINSRESVKSINEGNVDCDTEMNVSAYPQGEYDVNLIGGEFAAEYKDKINKDTKSENIHPDLGEGMQIYSDVSTLKENDAELVEGLSEIETMDTKVTNYISEPVEIESILTETDSDTHTEEKVNNSQL